MIRWVVYKSGGGWVGSHTEEKDAHALAAKSGGYVVRAVSEPVTGYIMLYNPTQTVRDRVVSNACPLVFRDPPIPPMGGRVGKVTIREEGE